MVVMKSNYHCIGMLMFNAVFLYFVSKITEITEIALTNQQKWPKMLVRFQRTALVRHYVRIFPLFIPIAKSEYKILPLKK